MTRARQLREFWKALADLLDAGLPLVRTLNIIAKDQGTGKFGDDIRSMTELIIEGSTFAEAASTLPEMFNDWELDLVRAGEVGGMIEVIANRISKTRGIITTADQLEHFWRSLSVHIVSGVPLLAALRKSSNVFDTGSPYRKAIDAVRASIKEGDTLAAPLDESKLFSALEVNMVDVGEETGSFDAMLMRIADLSAA